MDPSEVEMTLRTVREDELADLLPLFNATRSDPVDLDGFAERRRRFGPTCPGEYAVGEPAQAYVRVDEFAAGSGIRDVSMAVREDARRKGMGSTILAEIERRFPTGELRIGVRETNRWQADALERRGYSLFTHMFEASLDLSNWSAPEIVVPGIRLASLAELGNTEEWQYAIHRVEWETDHDIPGVTPPEIRGWEQYRAETIGSPGFRPALSILAFEGDEVVGGSMAMEFVPGMVYHHLTGVRKAWRGRGIGLLAKVAVLRAAQDLGIHTAKTNNDTRNAPMIGINERLGYVQEPGWLIMAKKLFE